MGIYKSFFTFFLRHRGEGARNARISIETQTKTRTRPPAANSDKFGKGGEPDLGARSPTGGTEGGRSPLGDKLMNLVISNIRTCRLDITKMNDIFLLPCNWINFSNSKP